MNGFENYWAQIEPAIRDNLPSRVLAKAVVAQLCTLARIAIECEKGKQDQEIPTLETIEMRKREIQAQWNEETRERRSHGEDYDGLSKMLTLNHRHETREANQRQKTDRRSMERKRKSEME